jgi:hypothetical protein
MEKTLEQVRLLHYLVIGAAIVALVLAFTKHSDVAERYDLAIKEMTIVRGLVGHDWKESGDAARNLYAPLNLSTIQRVREGIAKRAGAFVSAHLSADLKASRNMPSLHAVELRWDAPFLNRLDLPITATLKDIQLHFDAIPILVVTPRTDELLGKSRALASPPNGTTRIDIKVNAVVDLPAHVSTHGWASASTTLPADVTMRYFGTGDSLLLAEKMSVAAQIERLPPFSQWDVLLRSYRYFHQALPLVEKLTPDQAIFYLEEKASGVSSNATFLGVSVPRSMIFITAGSMLGLLFVFSRSLVHINRTFSFGPENLQTLRNFSWIALFNDSWSGHFNYLSILVLPTAAVCFLGFSNLLGLGTKPSLTWFALLIAITGTSLVLSQSALAAVNALRRCIAIAESNAANFRDEG